MCLFPVSIENPRYRKRQDVHPAVKYVTAKCGKCIECRQARAREWQQRLYEECIDTKTPHAFVTLTIDNATALEFGIDYTESVPKDGLLDLYERENIMVKKLVQRWRLRCNKKGIKQRHFFITEHGETRSERIHLHGILWAADLQEVAEQWKAGIADVGEMRDSTIPYIVKYMHKEQAGHPDYKSIVLTTPGIGKGYCRRKGYVNRWRSEKTDFTYRLPNGRRVALCEYYMKKLYKKWQLEARRILLSREGKRWVRGLEYCVRNGQSERNYVQKLVFEQKKHPVAWKKEKSNINFALQYQERNVYETEFLLQASRPRDGTTRN